MKKIFAALTICLCLFACDSEPAEGEFMTDDGTSMGDTGGDTDDDGTVELPPAQTFRAKVNGVNFFASGENVSSRIALGIFAITAIDNITGDEIVMLVENAGLGEAAFNTAPGSTAGATYDPVFDDDQLLSSAFLSLGADDSQGTINLTELDLGRDRSSGTFSFTAKRRVISELGEITTELVDITEGEFLEVSYSDDLGGVNDNTFTAELEGTELRENIVTVNAVDVEGETFLRITGINLNTGQVLGMQFNASLNPGTYEFDGLLESGANVLVYAPDATESESPLYNTISGGNLTITEVTPAGRYIGTFEATMINFLDLFDPTIEVTNGSFDVAPE